jgi:hypothetical protein
VNRHYNSNLQIVNQPINQLIEDADKAIEVKKQQIHEHMHVLLSMYNRLTISLPEGQVEHV